MAGIYPSGSVQDVASKGEVPERFIHKESHGRALEAPLMEAPVIDIGLLSSSSSNVGPELEKLKLRHGLHSWGCFQAINHGMSPEFLEEVRQVTKQFFALPMEDKLKYLRDGDEIEGYGNDTVYSDDQILDWNDRLFLTLYPEESRCLKYWPTNPERFREVIDEYTANMRLISEKILKAMARSLDLDENSFFKQFGEGFKLDARFSFYPRCRNPDHVLGAKPHADKSAITILLQDKEVEGIQFLKGNEWFNAPIIVSDALLVSVGDQAEIASNGIFKSRVHRALTNSEMERISLEVFYLRDSPSMSSSMIQLLASEKLTEDNYGTWKSNLNMILMMDDLRFVLTEECPQVPSSLADRSVRDVYDRWTRANDKARVYILASMSDVLIKKHESMVTAKEIMSSLQAMFGQPSLRVRYEALKYVYNSRMKEGTSVREHVLNMMDHFNTAEVNGAVIDEKSQVIFILESLPKSFLQFYINTVLNKIEFNLISLLNELHTYQSFIKSKGHKTETNVVAIKKIQKGSSSGNKSRSSFSKNKSIPMKKMGKWKVKTPAIRKNKGKITNKGKCFHCNEDGHWKQNCPKYRVEKN